MDEAELDPRQCRTRAALAAAVLALAAERGIDALSVTEITARAGVHRSTFYQHASSPLDLVKSTLARELDALRDRDAQSQQRRYRAKRRGDDDQDW